jgi:hypothetical protein
MRHLHDRARSDELRGAAKAAVRNAARQRRIAFADDYGRNAPQLVLGLRLLADDVPGHHPADGSPPAFGRELSLLAEGLERRLSRAGEPIEGGGSGRASEWGLQG